MAIYAKKQIIFIFILLTSYKSIITQNKATNIWTYESFKDPKTDALSPLLLKRIKTIFNSKIFIETGTYWGTTAVAAAKIYNQVLTVELSSTLYNSCLKRFHHHNNIKAHLGTSVEFLKNITSNNANLDNATFWLDAHWSCGITARNGTENTPVVSELDLIANATKLPIILIDDIRFFQPHEIQAMLPDSWKGYPTMQELNNKITTSMPLHKFVIYGDIAIIYPKNSIIFSDTILSMTNSLLYFDDNNSNLAQDAELKIAYNSTEKERREIIRSS